MKYFFRPLLVFLCLLSAAGAQTLDTEQLNFLTLINNYRAQNGAGPLQISLTLQQSSQWMSEDMAAKNYFSHTDSLGRDPFTRMAAFGYSYGTYKGENLAAGNSSAQGALTQWQNACDADSSGACTYAHRVNMLNPNYKVIGIGRAYGAGSTYRWYWTTDFGGYVDQTGGTGGGGGGGGTPAPSILFFSATPSSVVPGQSTILSWSVSGATTVAIDSGVGDVTSQTSRVVTPSQTTTYRLTATNSGGSTSASTTVSVATVSSDTQPPTTPSISAAALSASQVNLFWTMSTDNIGVAGYQIFRNGTLLTALSGTQSYTDISVSGGTDYTYTVRAYDAAGNYSALSRGAQVTTPGTASGGGTPVPAAITVFAGSGQSATVATGFPARLQAKVVDAKSAPVSGVTVSFSTPTSGPSATFFGAGGVLANVSTDANGIATSPELTANGIAGTFTVSATVTGLAPAVFTLSNATADVPPPPSTATTIWGTDTPSYWSYQTGSGMEFGVRFRSDVAGTILGVRFFKIAGDGGVHTGSLWTRDGKLLATGTFVNETAAGWQTVMFSSPVAISANTTYIASYHTNSGTYATSPFFFWSHGGDNSSLHALQNGVDGQNGVFASGSATTFPSNGSTRAENYWVDVLFGR